ncbi:nuclear transport factor 2 family protein [Thermodesulfobacteriota bacterium]
MRKLTAISLRTVLVLSLFIMVSCAHTGTKVSSYNSAGGSSYGEDRAQIEDLQARYMFALDFGDLDTYVKTFTEDGILDIIGMKWQGREEIKKGLEGMPAPEGEEIQDKGPYPATGRHNITNIVIKVDGNKATGRAYWFHYGNDNPERKATLDSYGYYEDEMVKVNGEWLFSKRIIYNEQMAEWIGSSENPSW